MNHNFILANCDTDAIMITKPDGSEFKELEKLELLNELNFLMPENITWEDDGSYSCVLIVKAKNYVMYDGVKKKTKGSSFRDQKKEPALRELMDALVDVLLNGGNTKDCVAIYHKYVKEAHNIQDISRWATKKTITKAVLTGERKNETKVLDAIGEDHVNEGDKIWIYSAIDGEIQAQTKGEIVFYSDGTPKMVQNCILKQTKNFKNDQDKFHYIERVYKTVEILSTVLDMSQFINYSLKKNTKLLDCLV